MRSNKSSFKFGAGAAVCAMLLLGNACAREEMSVASPTERVPRAQDAFDAGAESADAEVRSDDAGARSGTADADAAATSRDAGAEARARAGSGGPESRPRAGGSQGGDGGTPVRELDGRAGAGGAGGADAGPPVAPEPEAAGGAGGTRGEAGSEPRAEAGSGGTGGARAEGGSRAEPEGAAGKPAEPQEPEDPEDEEEDDKGTDAGTSSGSDEPSACEQIATACAAVTDPSDDVRSCLSVGQAADASACAGQIEGCRQTCGAPLCEQVLVACPASGSGPVQGCHQIGVTDNAGDCFGDGVKCIEYCNEVATP